MCRGQVPNRPIDGRRGGGVAQAFLLLPALAHVTWRLACFFRALFPGRAAASRSPSRVNSRNPDNFATNIIPALKNTLRTTSKIVTVDSELNQTFPVPSREASSA